MPQQSIPLPLNDLHYHTTIRDSRHDPCVTKGIAESSSTWLGVTTQCGSGRDGPVHQPQEDPAMKWTKPEAEVIAVTMEVTAYVATL